VAEPARPADAVRERLTGALRKAMKNRDSVAVDVLRSLMSAIDNAGAVPLTKPSSPMPQSSGEAPRHELSAAEVEQVLRGEAAERGAAAADYERRGQRDEASRLEAQLRVIADFLTPT
jgi:hypothetical protein